MLIQVIPFTGLLTVDPSKRLQMKDLRSNEWLQGNNVRLYPATPLMTPDVLTSGSSARSAEMGVKQTFSAFLQAHREGFRLQVSYMTSHLVVYLYPNCVHCEMIM
jgi:hypothetical protein